MKGTFFIKVGGQQQKMQMTTYTFKRICELLGMEVNTMFSALTEYTFEKIFAILQACAETPYWMEDKPAPAFTERQIMGWIDENGGLVAVSTLINEQLEATILTPSLDKATEAAADKKKVSKKSGQ